MSGRHSTSGGAQNGRSGWDERTILIAALVLVAGLGWTVALTEFSSSGGSRDLGAGRGSSSATGSHSEASASSSRVREKPHPDSAVSRCAGLFQGQLAAVEAANVSLDQWQMHIRAIDAVLDRDVPLGQAQSLWRRTRTGAVHKADTFAALAHQVSNRTCATPASVSPPLRVCQRASSAYGQAVRDAELTIHTWQMHIQQMENLPPNKGITRHQERMWRDMWDMGQHQIATYHRDLRRAQQLTCPLWSKGPLVHRTQRADAAPAMQQIKATTPRNNQ